MDGTKRYLVSLQEQSHVREGTPRFVEKTKLAHFSPCSSVSTSQIDILTHPTPFRVDQTFKSKFARPFCNRAGLPSCANIKVLCVSSICGLRQRVHQDRVSCVQTRRAGDETVPNGNRDELPASRRIRDHETGGRRHGLRLPE